MITERVYLEENNNEVYIDTYISNKIHDLKRSAILVIPGGGYAGVYTIREGEPIAQAFIPYGYNAFVMHYTTGKKKPYPAQLIEVSKAIKHIKDNAEKYDIDPERVFVVGFSAGGHLTGSLATMWHKKEIYDAVDMPFGYNKPTGAMMIYPVVNAQADNDFSKTFEYLLCEENPSSSDLDKVAINKNVDENTAPIFICHTSNDQMVSVKNSLLLAQALADNNKQFEMHIFPDAPHGMALGNRVTECLSECPDGRWNNAAMGKWVEHATFWASNIK